MSAHIEFISTLFSLVVLAVVLGVIGFAVSKVINHIQQSRSERFVSSAAELARARAYARTKA